MEREGKEKSSCLRAQKYSGPQEVPQKVFS